MNTDITKTPIFNKLVARGKQKIDFDFVKLVLIDDYDSRYEEIMDITHEIAKQANLDYWTFESPETSEGLDKHEILAQLFRCIFDYFNELADRVCTNYMKTKSEPKPTAAAPCDVER